MSDASRKNAPKTRGKPFQRGNPGRPRGARHKATIAAEVLLDGEAETLTRKAIELAKTGDTIALRLCLERILPARKDRPVTCKLPLIANASDAAKGMAAILDAVATGDLTPSEGAEVARLIETYAKTLEATEFETRLKVLEEKAEDK